MQNKEKNRNQVRLFQQIKKVLPHTSLAAEISDFLEIGIDPVYRRVRGDMTISFEEAIKLCRRFGISLDSFVYDTNPYQMKFELVPYDITNIDSYYVFAQDLASITNAMKSTSESKIILSAADISVFHFLEYMDMTVFLLFSWKKSVSDLPINYEEFFNELDTERLSKYYKNIIDNYSLIESSEIWTNYTIDSILKLIKYHFEMKHFNDNSIPLLLCEQLLDLNNKLQNWMKIGTKGLKGAPFHFYLNDIDLGNTFLLFKNAGISNCFIKLFTVNGINILDKEFCQEVEIWLESLTKRSIALSKISEKERFQFVSSQKQKIASLIKTIENS